MTNPNLRTPQPHTAKDVRNISAQWILVAVTVAGIALWIRTQYREGSVQWQANQAIIRKDFGLYQDRGVVLGIMAPTGDPIAGSEPAKAVPMRANRFRGYNYYGAYNHYLYCYLIEHPILLPPPSARCIGSATMLARDLAVRPPSAVVRECLAGNDRIFFGVFSPAPPYSSLPGLSESEMNEVLGNSGGNNYTTLGFAVSLRDFDHCDFIDPYTRASPDEVRTMASYNRELFQRVAHGARTG